MRLTLPRWIAHRGGGSLAPENTLAGIRLAAQLGYRAVEFDVMLSGDGTPVLIHDETLVRTTGVEGRVSDTPDSLLLGLDAGQGERIPTLDEAIALCCRLGLLANVEIKPASGFDRQTAERVAGRCADAVRQSGFQVLLSSFSAEALDVARHRAPEVPRGLLFEQVPTDWMAELRRFDALTLHCSAVDLPDALLAEAAGAEVPVLVYTVNPPEMAESLFRRGVAAIFTDNLAAFANETSAYKGLQLHG